MAFTISQKIVLMFLACQLLALWAGVTLINSAAGVPEIRELSIAPGASADDPFNAAFFLGYVVFGAVGMLLVIRFVRTRIFFFALEFVVLLGSVWVLALGILHSFGFGSIEDELLISAAIGLLAAIAKLLRPSLKNVAAVLSSAGVGALFGFSIGFVPALLFVLGISLYDYLAVFMTRHMLKLSGALGTSDLSFTVTATASSKKAPSAPQYSRHSPDSKSFKPVPVHLPAEPERLDLGSGDLAVPAMLAVASYPVAGIAGSFAVAAGSTISLYLLLGLVTKRRVALPAMPPISIGALIALLIVLLLGA